MKKALSIIGNSLLTILIIIETVMAVSLAFFRTGGDTPSVFGYSLYVVATGSMEPEIHVGDMIVDKVYKGQELEVGDVVTYLGKTGTFNGKMVTHEIINIDEETGAITTKGIANETPDPQITKSDIKGIMVFKTTIVGKLYGFLMKPVGFIFVIILPMLIFIMYEAVSLAVNFKMNKEEEIKEEKEEN